jgi:hypothetical protein
MTDERDIERILGRWLGDGPTEVPDRVMDVVVDRIGRQSQRNAWRLDWRRPTMNTSLRAAVGLAAVVILAIGAIYLRGSPSGSNIGGPAATPSPSPTASPTPAPSLKAFTSSTFQPALRFEAPASWVFNDGLRASGLDVPAASPGGGGSIGLMTAPFVDFADRDCSDRAPAGLGTSIAEVVAALAGDPRLLTTPPQAVTMGDRTGQTLDIQIASDWSGTCAWSDGMPAVLILSATDAGPAYGLRGPERARLIFLDVGESVVSIAISPSDASTFEAFLAQTTPIVDSMRFTP